ncbi:DMT family transporter [Porphyromonadaceae bacterium]
MRKYHLAALITITIWGVTFVSTRTLLDSGLLPSEIFFIRFVMAYLMLWIFNPRIELPRSWRDELLFVAVGATGGSIYFLTENTALQHTLVSNVGLIVTTAPLLTAFAAHVSVKGERLHKNLLVGAAVAMLGVALVIFNGNFILQLNPLGDILALSAAASWAVYTVIIKRLAQKYSMRMITRRVFFYGIITLLPWFLYEPMNISVDLLLETKVWANLLFLGIIASAVCFIVWNVAIKHLGSIRTNNYIYFTPIVTLLSANIVLGEIITPLAIVGAVLIIGGVYWAERK